MPETAGSAPRLPHREPARLVESVLAREAGRMRAIARIPDRSPFLSQRADTASAPAVLALEMAAQVAAAFEHETVERSTETHGLLVGVRDALFHAHELSADADFQIEVELHGETGGLREWSFSVRSEGLLLAEGTLLTYLAGS